MKCYRQNKDTWAFRQQQKCVRCNYTRAKNKAKPTHLNCSCFVTRWGEPGSGEGNGISQLSLGGADLIQDGGEVCFVFHSLILPVGPVIGPHIHFYFASGMCWGTACHLSNRKNRSPSLGFYSLRHRDIIEGWATPSYYARKQLYWSKCVQVENEVPTSVINWSVLWIIGAYSEGPI